MQLSDPAVPGSRQPYHAGLGTARTDRRALERLIRVVERYARASLAPVFRDARSQSRALRGVGLVVGSEIDPALIANPHIRAHASEGRLYRRVLDTAARRRGLSPLVVVERTLFASAVKRLRQSEAALRRRLQALRLDGAGGWGADEKAAALVAWLTLLGRPTPRARAARRRVAA